MHDHRTAGFGRHWNDRRRLALATAILVIAAVLVVTGPWLALLAAVEWKLAAKPHRGGRLIGWATAGLLWRALVWLWLELAEAPHGPWHPCAQCGRPIERPSRAAYCSHSCRQYALLERDAQADGRVADRARRRVRAIELRRLTDERPEWVEVPF
jgi:hypothetical protein